MSCTALTTIAKTCDKNPSGIKSIWIWDMEDQSTFTEDAASWNITALEVGLPTAPIGYEFVSKASEYTEEGTEALETGGSTLIQTINLVFARREAAKSKAIKILGEGQRYLGALVLTNAGKYWVFQDLQLTTFGGGSGITGANTGSNYNISLISDNQLYLAKEMSPALALNFIADGSTLVS